MSFLNWHCLVICKEMFLGNMVGNMLLKCIEFHKCNVDKHFSSLLLMRLKSPDLIGTLQSTT